MTTLIRADPADQPAEPTGDVTDTTPRADCTADSAGGLTFDVTDHGASGAAHLVLRRRPTESQPGDSDSSGDGKGDGDDELRLPLSPAADGSLRAALPSSVELAEGRWDVYAQLAGEKPQRLAPGLNDLRSLVDRVPSGARGHVAVRIPYATQHGNLTVRSWWRAPHAEAGELLIDGTELTVHGRVYGTGLTDGAYAELSGRRGTAPAVRAEVTVRESGFVFTVAYADLVEAGGGPGVWDLWLRPTGDTGPRVRLARLLDDVADKQPIFTYPATRMETEHGTADAGPYYTLDNDLSVRVALPS
ncbi:hypothetical protein ACIQNU_36095 [Streptomyces sp. NPDC091292]|uniref:hypothetical protein n=1 Tax=Streptomyces sp. NPDC091292 TaxID=3365991 RepID=UPI00381DC36C